MHVPSEFRFRVSWLIGLLLAAASCSGSSSRDASVDAGHTSCTAAKGLFAAAYEAKSAVPSAGPCALLGEGLGVQVYNPPSAGGNADAAPTLLAIKGQSLVDALMDHDPDPSHFDYSSGPFATAEALADGFCDVPTLSPAEQDLAATGVLPATRIVYEWSRVRVLVSGNANGTELIGDLHYTRDDCNATYRVRALFPLVDCSNAAGEADFCQCLPYADPDKGRLASGIGPELFGEAKFGADACESGPAQAGALESAAKVTCDRNTHLCVLKAEPAASSKD